MTTRERNKSAVLCGDRVARGHVRVPCCAVPFLCFVTIMLCGNMFRTGNNGGAVLYAREVYRSNAVGVIVSELPPDTPSTSSGYLLVIEDEDETRTVERLYRDGEELRRTESVISGRVRIETIYKSNIISQQNSYDSSERLTSVIDYDPEGTVKKSIRYSYRPNTIIADHIDNIGMLLFREQQTIDQNGRVKEIVRDYADGRMERVEFVFVDRRLLREVHQLQNSTLTLVYDAFGRIMREEQLSGDVLKRRVEYGYGTQPTNRLPTEVSTTEVDGELTIRTDQKNNADGEVVEQLLYENDILVEESSFTYQQGDLRSVRVHRTGSTSQREFIYDQAGEQIEERWYENGVIVRSVAYETNNDAEETTEYRYVDGRPYVRIEFRNGVRLKEEFLSDNDVARERVLE